MVSTEGVYYHAINRYKVVAFLKQLISWAASEILRVENSNEFPTAEINSLNESI